MAGLLLTVILAGGWFAYSMALDGAFLLDDMANLGGLGSVNDGASALRFIFSGEAGPLGRPLALTTFAAQASAWGQGAAPFLSVNIQIHLVNGCLVAFVLYRLSRLRGAPQDKALFAAIAAAAIWLYMPLLASSSLMVVQRMTTLAALFMLLGLAGYLQARRSIEQHPARSLAGMTISLVAGTALAGFSKENGVLLPTLVLVIEATLLTRPSSVRLPLWRVWMLAFLALPTMAILVYLAWLLPYSTELSLRRDFTGWERLLTESKILWQYLLYAVVPQTGQLGPFHDGYPVARTLFQPMTFVAVLAWLAALVLAVAWRRRFPLFSFAVLWFVGGHLLESTVVSLELYFEHRNYVPLIGPVYAACFAITKMDASRLRLAYAGVSAYVLVNAMVLASTASLWGNPPMAAYYWQEHFPDSVRAATNVAELQLRQEGPRSAMQTLRTLVEVKPEAGYLKIQELNLSCIIDPRGDKQRIVKELGGLLKTADFSYTAGRMLSELFTTTSNIPCNGVDGGTLRQLSRALLGNPRYKGDASYNQLHHQLMAQVSRHEGSFDDAIGHLEQAADYKPWPRLNMMMVTIFVDAERFDAARDYIDEARGRAPWRPVSGSLWQQDLDELSRYVDEVQRARDLQPAPSSALPSEAASK